MRVSECPGAQVIATYLPALLGGWWCWGRNLALILSVPSLDRGGHRSHQKTSSPAHHAESSPGALQECHASLMQEKTQIQGRGWGSVQKKCRDSTAADRGDWRLQQDQGTRGGLGNRQKRPGRLLICEIGGPWCSQGGAGQGRGV